MNLRMRERERERERERARDGVTVKDLWSVRFLSGFEWHRVALMDCGLQRPIADCGLL